MISPHSGAEARRSRPQDGGGSAASSTRRHRASALSSSAVPGSSFDQLLADERVVRELDAALRRRGGPPLRFHDPIAAPID